jgi:DDE superfamily endonuclease
LIDRADRTGEQLGLSVWTQDEAGPYQTLPYPGASWQPVGHPALQPHEYIRHGTAKLLTLFHPATGRVRVKGVTSSANVVLHPWLKAEVSAILQSLPEALPIDAETNRQLWEAWQEGLSLPITLPQVLPALRMLLIWDNLRGHYTPEIVLWLFAHGIMLLYTPLGGSWLNMAESMQRILVKRGLAGQYPETPDQIISLLEGVANGWNQDPTPFEWGGKRAARRQRSRQRRHALGGSGACTCRPVRHRPSLLQKWPSSYQTTH